MLFQDVVEELGVSHLNGTSIKLRHSKDEDALLRGDSTSSVLAFRCNHFIDLYYFAQTTQAALHFVVSSFHRTIHNDPDHVKILSNGFLIQAG